MKLATALAERSDIQNRINTISVRLDNNAKVQEGDVPAEDPKALMEELDRLIVRLEDLVARINLTNSGTVYEGKTIITTLIGCGLSIILGSATRQPETSVQFSYMLA